MNQEENLRMNIIKKSDLHAYVVRNHGSITLRIKTAEASSLEIRLADKCAGYNMLQRARNDNHDGISAADQVRENIEMILFYEADQGIGVIY